MLKPGMVIKAGPVSSWKQYGFGVVRIVIDTRIERRDRRAGELEMANCNVRRWPLGRVRCCDIRIIRNNAGEEAK